MILSAFVSALSQLLLKMSAGEKHESRIRQYLNTKVIVGYILMLLTMLMNVWAYQTITYRLGPVLAASSYVFIVILSIFVLKEKLTVKKTIGIIMIISGVCVSSLL